MKHFFNIFGAVCACFVGAGAYAATANKDSRIGTIQTVNVVNSNTGTVANSGNALRGNQALANAYQTNMRNSYYIVNVPDVDTACRQKIYNCLSAYCGDVTVVPGKQSSRCAIVEATELYNYALLCLQKDTSVLLPQYGSNTRTGVGGTNTAAQLCPKYVQQEVMSYLSMSVMADQLTKSRSADCLVRRQEYSAALACHSVALAYGNETASLLRDRLNDACGAGVSGGSAEMVTRFANAGNVGANIWGWAEKVVTLDVNKKASDWQYAVDTILASYLNRKNLACGENTQLNLTTSAPSSLNQSSVLQTLATNALVGAANDAAGVSGANNPAVDLYMEVMSASEIYTAQRAFEVVNAAISSVQLVQNAFLTTMQMDSMQKAYVRGTKVFILRDSARCYVVPVAELSASETSILANVFSSCTYK
ncbi:MAG: hypothetical protein K6B71_03045 [Alphaproteobacteria bacterium]|nr:hypothetical protein [Alphaproteobacteria bacterium]